MGLTEILGLEPWALARRAELVKKTQNPLHAQIIVTG
jgi:hypothetical protein